MGCEHARPAQWQGHSRHLQVHMLTAPLCSVAPSLIISSRFYFLHVIPCPSSTSHFYFLHDYSAHSLFLPLLLSPYPFSSHSLRGIVFCGGFSYADVNDSAKGWAGQCNTCNK